MGEVVLPHSFAEPLPASCPPPAATDGPVSEVIRLVANDPAIDADFYSKAKLGHVMPSGADACGWSSCSLYRDIKPLLKYKRLRQERPFQAVLEIPAGHGLHVENPATGHVDFWVFAGNSLATTVISIQVAN
jgi:hypothetical protein